MNILYYPQKGNFENELNSTYKTLFSKDSNFFKYESQVNNLTKYDLILLPGGGDFAPYYSFKSDNNISYDEEYDYKELELINKAINQHVPVFGICRGMQAILLYFHIPLILDIKGHMDITHEAILANKKRLFINSFHHQGTYKAPGFDIFLRSIDGIVEGIAHNSLPLYGIQFHLEQMPNKEDFQFFLPVISR